MLSPAPAAATQFVFFATLAVACRWSKRNPSNFLRFILFPFGGIHVERWPRFMLRIVRVGAILGFYIFLGGLLAVLFPSLLLNPAPAVLYTKIALEILVTFLVMQGSTEPFPERIPTAKTLRPLTLPAASGTPANTAQAAQPRLSEREAPPVPSRAYPVSPPPEEVVQARKRYALSTVVIGLLCTAFCFVFGGTGMGIFFF